ncbi:MAG TPA: hypothetical protein VF297_13465 [Pyrinomonadaceae bacterium]
MRNDAISLKEFWGIIVRLKEDTTVCLRILEETPEDDEANRSFWRRMYALAVFSFLDGVTYRMTFHAYAARERRDVVFMFDELTRLEKMYDFDEDAEPVSACSHAPMLDNIRFAFNAFARVHYSDYVLPTADPDWAFLREVVRIRARLEHPRAPEELEVYEETVEELLQGLRWYVDRVAELLEDCLTRFEAKVIEWGNEENEVIM